MSSRLDDSRYCEEGSAQLEGKLMRWSYAMGVVTATSLNGPGVELDSDVEHSAAREQAAVAKTPRHRED